jgi:hypothetical protein
MNRLRFNSGVFNSRSVAQALAFVAITASASVSAELTYVYRSASAINGAATLSVAPTQIRSLDAAIVGNAFAAAVPSHQIAGRAACEGGAEFVAYVLRAVLSGADLGGSAELTAIPAGLFSSAEFSGTTEIYAAAVRDQRSAAAILAIAESEGDALASRTASAFCAGAVLFRVEPTLNGVHDTYADIEVGAVAEFSALCTKLSAALVTGVAEFAGTPVYRHAVFGAAAGAAEAVITSDVIKGALGFFSCQAELEADVLYVHPAVAAIPAQALATATARQRHVVTSVVSGGATIEVLASNRWVAFASLQGSGALGAEITYQYRASCAVIGSGGVQAAGVQTHVSAASLSGWAESTALAAVTVGVVAHADLLGDVLIWAIPGQTHVVTAVVLAGATVKAVPGHAHAVGGVVFAEALIQASPDLQIPILGSAEFVGVSGFVGDGAVKEGMRAESTLSGAAELVGAMTQFHVGYSPVVTRSVVVANAEMPPLLPGAAEFVGYVELNSLLSIVIFGAGHFIGRADATARGFFTRVIVGDLPDIEFPDDPPERTFVRPASLRVFERPEGMRVFRRVS